ncbi:hypothetical protein ACQKWADRAFT_320655 [Trichoderma austrokoningii]
MPISALPQSTVRILGSSVVITTPCDVVKELIDNAIDAGASYIKVLVSSNYLDMIQVRDDGHGIDIDDFDALGRRAHTSKLKTFDELGFRAKETLGFRGEALAAMNIFAAVSIVTRTSTDVVATHLELKRAVGGTENTSPSLAPVGTTVQVAKLFDMLPARKQYSLQNTAKYIKSTQDLLKTYALARPDLRLSFKVLGKATSGWSYAPTCVTDINEAALQIFGKPLANSCIHVSRNSACDQAELPQGSQQAAEDFILEAFIPKPGCDVHAIKGKGLYLSVDSRPLSTTCGIAKKITTIFRSYFNSITGSTESIVSIPNPFLRLNIRCPAYSYDANVSSLKDDVLFGDENKIIACFMGLCQRIYAERDTVHPFLTPEPLKSKEDVEDIQAAENVNLIQSTSTSTDQATASPPLRREPDSQDRLSLTKMRTSKIVNMSRTSSNATDDDNTINSVDIQVPLSLKTAPQIPPRPKPPVPKISLSENIDRYLLPRKSEDFQIATDETATEKSGLRRILPESPPGAFGRMPLQPLTESMLNAMNGQSGSESDASSTSTLDDNIERTNNVNPREERAQQTSPASTLPLRDYELSAFYSPRQSRSVAEWPTPPSSGLLRGGRSSNPLFGLPLGPAEGESPTGNPAVRRRPRGPPTRRVIPFTLPGENRNRRRATHDQTREREADLSRATPRVTPRATLRSNRPQLFFRGVQGLRRQERSTINASGPASQMETMRQNVSQPSILSPGRGRRSHRIQAPLPDSQPPGAIPRSRAARDGSNAHDSRSVTPHRDTRPSIKDAARAPSANTNDELEDPRFYLIARQRSQARHGIVRRISSRLLPLSVTPNDLATHNLSISIKISLGKIEKLATQICFQGHDIAPEGQGTAVTLKKLREDGKLETCIQNAVDLWKKMQNQAIEVEYRTC